MREEFLWLVFDFIQSHSVKVNNELHIACMLIGTKSPLINNATHLRHFKNVCRDALLCLKITRFIYNQPAGCYSATKKQTKEQFLEAFEKVSFEGEKQC
jgi:hypothetical protein